CTKCREVCPVEGAIAFEDSVRMLERTVGAVIVAVGASLLDCRTLPQLGYGTLQGVVTSLEFERLLAADGPLGGDLRTPEGKAPSRIALIQCTGSLDAYHASYCSEICCRSALKYRAMLRERLPDSEIVHFVKEWCLPGCQAQVLYESAMEDRSAFFVRYADIGSFSVQPSKSRLRLSCRDMSGSQCGNEFDMIILCPAVVPAGDAATLAKTLRMRPSRYGFVYSGLSGFEHETKAPRGILAVGSCSGPKDIRTAATEGGAAAGRILAELKNTGRLEVNPTRAHIVCERCSGCGICAAVCPLGAIVVDKDGKRAEVISELCDGCGVCVAGCPAAAIVGNHFTDEQIRAELDGLLDTGM
ncbi:MAG TPA: 4Fe-4S dicluster domain-containing protein, partial [Dissulfurispiraceae bacterium]|nr:4Fe-4S dicluster domain-containing protein [Dissulfurispiraceae bacterium]